jgi:glucose-6-phosphate 1-dehydrogenase
MKNNDKKPTSIVVFGATGDLAKRKLFPAFFNLFWKAGCRTTLSFFH